jgi:hypothetical protein
MLSLASKIKILGHKIFPTFDGGGGIQMAFRQSEMPDETTLKDLLPAIREIEELRKKKCRFVQLNTAPPGFVSGVHTDTLRCDYHLERWHFVIATNKDAWFEDEINGKFHMDQGGWYGPVAYWKPHNVGNNGNTERVHLVVDLETDGQPISEDDLRGVPKSVNPPASDLKPSSGASTSK